MRRTLGKRALSLLLALALVIGIAVALPPVALAITVSVPQERGVNMAISVDEAGNMIPDCTFDLSLDDVNHFGETWSNRSAISRNESNTAFVGAEFQFSNFQAAPGYAFDRIVYYNAVNDITSDVSSVNYRYYTQSVQSIDGQNEMWALMYGMNYFMVVFKRTGPQVTFNGNGGAPNVFRIAVANPNMALAARMPADPTRSGYTFNGWNTKQDGTGTPFTSGTGLQNHITVYAQWKSTTYTVTFDGNGGTPATQSKSVQIAPNATIGTLPAEPTRTGYKFLGWNMHADGKGSAFTASTHLTGDITVYANWAKMGNTYWDALDNLLVASMTTAEIVDELKTIDVAGAMQDPGLLNKLQDLEQKYKTLAGITVTPQVDTSAQENFPSLSASDVSVIGAAFNAQSPGTMTLQFSKPAKDVDIDEANFDKDNAVQLDIDLLFNGNPITGRLDVPIMITMPIPDGIVPQNFRILHYFQDESYEIISPIINVDGTCSFIVDRFSVFVFTNALSAVSSGGRSSSDKSTPPVPVVYDIVKSGESFTFKTIIANANGKMAGASVTVKLNDKYQSVVTISENGVGEGKLEAPGFSGGMAVFSARINGIAGQNVSIPMLVTTTGKVVSR